MSTLTKEQRAALKAKVKGTPYQNPVKTKFPQPRMRKLNAPNARYFYEYWASIPEELHELIEVRSYRCWPIVNLQLVEPERRDYAWEFIEGKCPFDPDNFESQIMSRPGYGSGEYRFDLKEKGGQDIVISTYVKAIDLNLYPPVLDYKTLVQCDANKQFVRSLRRQNIPIPWDDPDDKENDDMAGSGELVTAALGAIKDLSQSAIQANKEAAEAKVDAIQAQLDQHDEDDDLDNLDGPSPALEAQKAGFQMVTHAATAAIDMMARHAGAQFNPIELMKAAKEMMGGGAELGMLVGAVQAQGDKMLQMQKEQFDFMRTLMTDRPQPVSQLDTLLQSAQQLKSLRELMGWGDDEDREPAAAVVPAVAKVPEKPLGQVIGENIVPIMGGLTTICALIANVIHNMKASGPQQLRNPAEDMLRAQQANPAAQMMQQPGMPPQMQPPPPQPQQAPDLMTLARAYIVKVSDAMKHHFFDPGFNGYTFAEYVRSDRTGAGDNAQGLQAYGTIKETLGREKFEQLIRESDIWPQLQGMPQKFKLFMDEFFGYEEWNSQQPAQETATAA